MRINPEQGLQFAQMLVQDEEPLADITQVRKEGGIFLMKYFEIINKYSGCLLFYHIKEWDMSVKEL